jgi:ribosomal protein L37AE/L43A
MTERAVPFYCPYCGEEDLLPQPQDGAWNCRSCTRSFRLHFAGIGVVPITFEPNPAVASMAPVRSEVPPSRRDDAAWSS